MIGDGVVTMTESTSTAGPIIELDLPAVIGQGI